MSKSGSTGQPPIFRNPNVVIFGEIVVDEGTKCVFKPWMDEGRTTIGLSATTTDQRVTYIYIAPDVNTSGLKPQFYLYIGPHGDPRRDHRLGPYDLEGGSDA